MVWEERCIRCESLGDKVKLLDALKEARPIKICESCVRTEPGVVVIRRPTISQLNAPNKPLSVYNRLIKMSGIDEKRMLGIEGKQEIPDIQKLIDEKHKKELSEFSIKKRQAYFSKMNKPLKLVDHYHWIIRRARTKRGLTHRRVSEFIGEPEIAIKMFESGKLTDDSRRLAEKLEQFFQVDIIKPYVDDEVDDKEIIVESEAINKNPSRVLKFDKNKMDNLTISDIVEMKKKRGELTRKTEVLSDKKQVDEMEESVDYFDPSIKRESYDEADMVGEVIDLDGEEIEFKGEVEFLD